MRKASPISTSGLLTLFNKTGQAMACHHTCQRVPADPLLSRPDIVFHKKVQGNNIAIESAKHRRPARARRPTCSTLPLC